MLRPQGHLRHIRRRYNATQRPDPYHAVASRISATYILSQWGETGMHDARDGLAGFLHAEGLTRPPFKLSGRNPNRYKDIYGRTRRRAMSPRFVRAQGRDNKSRVVMLHYCRSLPAFAVIQVLAPCSTLHSLEAPSESCHDVSCAVCCGYGAQRMKVPLGLYSTRWPGRTMFTPSLGLNFKVITR